MKNVSEDKSKNLLIEEIKAGLLSSEYSSAKANAIKNLDLLILSADIEIQEFATKLIVSWAESEDGVTRWFAEQAIERCVALENEENRKIVVALKVIATCAWSKNQNVKLIAKEAIRKCLDSEDETVKIAAQKVIISCPPAEGVTVQTVTMRMFEFIAEYGDQRQQKHFPESIAYAAMSSDEGKRVAARDAIVFCASSEDENIKLLAVAAIRQCVYLLSSYASVGVVVTEALARCAASENEEVQTVAGQAIVSCITPPMNSVSLDFVVKAITEWFESDNLYLQAFAERIIEKFAKSIESLQQVVAEKAIIRCAQSENILVQGFFEKIIKTFAKSEDLTERQVAEAVIARCVVSESEDLKVQAVTKKVLEWFASEEDENLQAIAIRYGEPKPEILVVSAAFAVAAIEMDAASASPAVRALPLEGFRHYIASEDELVRRVVLAKIIVKCFRSSNQNTRRLAESEIMRCVESEDFKERAVLQEVIEDCSVSLEHDTQAIVVQILTICAMSENAKVQKIIEEMIENLAKSEEWMEREIAAATIAKCLDSENLKAWKFAEKVFTWCAESGVQRLYIVAACVVEQCYRLGDKKRGETVAIDILEKSVKSENEKVRAFAVEAILYCIASGPVGESLVDKTVLKCIKLKNLKVQEVFEKVMENGVKSADENVRKFAADFKAKEEMRSFQDPFKRMKMN